MRVAARWIPLESRILDIGCHQGEFFLWLGGKIKPSVGFDQLYRENSNSTEHQFFAHNFQEGLPFEEHSFDTVVLLATIEHIHDKSAIARESARLLRSGGRVIITVPSLLVDKLMDILIFLGIVDGMSLEQHHGFPPNERPIFSFQKGLNLEKKQKFQFGLNNLYIFERI